MSNSLGTHFKITTFGESHGPALGVVVDGVTPGLEISQKDIQAQLDRRKPGQKLTSPRKESDTVEILSGIFEGKTTGMPIAMLIRNKDAHSKSYDYLKDLFRPGHADFTYLEKYGIRDHRGGGRQSARETANWVAAGVIARKIIAKYKIKIVASVVEIAGIRASVFNEKEISKNMVNCGDKKAAENMVAAIEKARREGDSVGGIIEVVARNVPSGLGDPVFDKLDADLAKAFMSINAAKGVEIGSGFEAARMRGSEHNDVFLKKGGKIITTTNHAGGILGGISTGMAIVARVAFKPTSSITQEQDTVTTSGKNTTVRVFGRHDPCVAIRAVPIVEAMMANVLADAVLSQEALRRSR
ncbi:MAG: chorismate synthase [Nanoarchaeota archaeon]|nr:chorismate synthase [Nanoarchaeota archaeon]